VLSVSRNVDATSTLDFDSLGKGARVGQPGTPVGRTSHKLRRLIVLRDLIL
jgi:hypothetical protein